MRLHTRNLAVALATILGAACSGTSDSAVQDAVQTDPAPVPIEPAASQPPIVLARTPAAIDSTRGRFK